MAVVKLKYIRSRPQVKKHLRYITHRRGETQETITRLLFGRDGLMEKQRVYEMINSAERGTIFYKIMINPDPVKEDTNKDLDLQLVTRQTIRNLDKQLGRRLQFVATVHNDHTELRHVHGFFLLQGRVSREEFRMLREIAYQAATREARFQRSGRDRVRDNPRYRALHRYHALTQSVSARQSVSVRRRGRSVRPLNLQPGCLSCGYGQVFGIPSSRIFCPKCSARLTRVRTGGLRL